MALVPVTGISACAPGTAVAWAATNVAIPAGIICFESDTLKFKVGNGTALYSELEYVVSGQLSPEQLDLLTDAGDAGGVLVLDENGKVPLENLPTGISVGITFYADIDARDAVAVEDRVGIACVADATDDPSVASGMAYYGWNADTEAWVKLGEAESIDIDFTNFVQAGDDLDRLADSDNYVKMTPAERTKLDIAMTTEGEYLFTGIGPSFFTTGG